MDYYRGHRNSRSDAQRIRAFAVCIGRNGSLVLPFFTKERKHRPEPQLEPRSKRKHDVDAGSLANESGPCRATSAPPSLRSPMRAFI